MLVKDEPSSVPLEHVMASLPIIAWQHVARDWILAPTPTKLEYGGGCSVVVSVGSAPCPHPKLTGRSLGFDAVSFDWGGKRERMSF
jgi:hypothetical protein